MMPLALEGRVVVVGSANVDLVATTERVPEAGETVVGTGSSIGTGGKGANQAVAARRVGASVTMVGAVGADLFGTMVLDSLRAEGIDVEHVGQLDGVPTGTATILVQGDGDNRIVVVAGANAAVDPAVAAKVVRAAGAGAVVVAQLEVPQPVVTAAFVAARYEGAVTMLNPAPAAPLDARLLAVTDWLVPNEHELAEVAGSVGASLTTPVDDDGLREVAAALGVRLVVTLGAAGAALLREDGSVDRVAAPLVRAVDTTGAGDAFVGTFAAALASGAPEDEAVRLGCALAADSVTRPGAQASYASTADVVRLVAALRDV